MNESKLERRLRLLFDNCEVRFGPVRFMLNIPRKLVREIRPLVAKGDSGV